MSNIITDLRQRFVRADICLQFIYVNGAVFLLLAILSVFFRLFNLDGVVLARWLEFPADGWQALCRPWTLITYMFMHADVLHLLFNMLWLYCFGRMFLYAYSARHFRGLYLLGGMAGALLYLLAYNVFPFFRPFVSTGLLVGASASVLAIVVATAMSMPDYRIQLLLIGSVRLKYVALIMVLTDLLFITSANAGGHIAHLGGALAGWWFALGIRGGRYDGTAWINAVWDWLAGLFTRRPHKPKMKVHRTAGGKRAGDYEYNARKKESEAEIDRILDKVRKSGYEGLTAEEKRTLFDASKR